MKDRSAIGVGAVFLTICLGLIAPLACPAATAKLTIDVSNPGHPIPPRFDGLMTEEINYSYEGGLYAELIQNGRFQNPGQHDPFVPPKVGPPPIHWSVAGSGTISTNSIKPVNAALPVNLRLGLDGNTCGVANDGYWGIPIMPNSTYTASFYARANDGFSGPLTASLVLNAGNATVAKADTEPLTTEWKRYTVKLTTGADAASTAQAQFVLSATGSGSIDFSFVSLFPPTYQNTPNGLRPDLMKLLADMHPSFIRLPGGNYLEGDRFANRFNWKKTIGPVEERPGHMSPWGYRSSDGFGLPQYLLWCKQLDAEPVLAVFAGYCLNGDHFDAGSKELAIYTQEALDEIEYVTGPATSEWGKRRVADGFAEPFTLHYVEIGNEDFFDASGSYDGRFTQIAKAIREKYPNLKLIATNEVTSSKPDLYDTHMYAGPASMITQGTRFDPVPGPGNDFPKWNQRLTDQGIHQFVGEWATGSGRPTPNLKGALADAVFLMGLERNCDAIDMECYAPLFANVNPADPKKGYPRGWQWDTDLIGYDALHSYGSPSYYMQLMFGQNKADNMLPSTLDAAPYPQTLDATPHGMVGVGAWKSKVEYKDIVVTTPDGKKLSSDDLLQGPIHWQFPNIGWNVGNGEIKNGDENDIGWALFGDPKWDNYTIHMKARKISGEEGFLVMWHTIDNDSFHWWNIGGWGDTSTRFEAAYNGPKATYGPNSTFTVETGKWYDLRIEVNGHNVSSFIDDQPIISAPDEVPPDSAVKDYAFAGASYIKGSHEAVVKIVNNGDEPMDTQVNVQGASVVGPIGKAITLTGDLDAVNSLDQPQNIGHKEETVSNLAQSFKYTFPPHSITLLRFPAK